jgi:hypothetical protein
VRGRQFLEIQGGAQRSLIAQSRGDFRRKPWRFMLRLIELMSVGLNAVLRIQAWPFLSDLPKRCPTTDRLRWRFAALTQHLRTQALNGRNQGGCVLRAGRGPALTYNFVVPDSPRMVLHFRVVSDLDRI